MKWFWADLHLEQGEDLVEKLGRTKMAPAGWDRLCIEQLNNHVEIHDQLFLLGDFASRRPGFWRQLIRCKHVFLVVGNHDRNVQNVFGGHSAQIKTVKCVNVKTVLCHYPMIFWDHSHHGGYHLYGHIHAHEEREYVMDMMMPGRRSMDVSPESSLRRLCEFRPFSEDDVHEILGSRPGHDRVHFKVPK